MASTLTAYYLGGLVLLMAIGVVAWGRWEIRRDQRAASAVDSALPPQGAEVDVPGWPTATLPAGQKPSPHPRDIASELPTVPFPALYSGPASDLICGSDAPAPPTWADLPGLTRFSDWPMDGPADGQPFGDEATAELAACTTAAVALATQPMEPVRTEEAA